MASLAEVRSLAGKPTRRGFTASEALLVGALALVLLYFSRLPLAHIDLWGHLAWGRWIVEHGRLPATEPLMPLSNGVPVVDTAWLSQVIGYAVHALGGPTGLQFLHGLCITSCCAGVMAAIHRRTRSLFAGLLGLAILLLTLWFQWQIIRPQLAGQVAFAILLFLLRVRRHPRAVQLAVAPLFVFWANAHGSFAVGLLVILLAAAGRLIDLVVGGTRSIRDSVRDHRLRELATCGIIASGAAILNPYGPELYLEVAQFSSQPNLRDLVEWTPLDFQTWQGRIFFSVAATWFLLAVITRRTIRFQDGLPFFLLGLATVSSARFIVWWGPLAACGLAAAVDRVLSRAAVLQTGRPVRSHRWGICAALALFAGCALTPFARRVITGAEPPVAKTFSKRTPLAATTWLRQRPPSGQVFNSYDWGDYLVWAGPPGIEVFVMSHVHLIPPSVWRDYRSISAGREDWQARLDHYAVRTAILDRSRHAKLARAMSGSEAWEEVYRDRQAVIFSRRR